MSNDYWQYSAVELAEGIRRRDYWCVDVLLATRVMAPGDPRNPWWVLAPRWFDVATYQRKTALDPLAHPYGSETAQRIFHWYYRLGVMVKSLW